MMRESIEVTGNYSKRQWSSTMTRIGGFIILFLGSSFCFAQAQRLIVYPANGQSADQVARDRFECHEWSVDTSGIDPATLAGNQASPSPEATTSPAADKGSNIAKGVAIGAVAGAVLGSTIHESNRGRHQSEGNKALPGAVVGAAIGGVIGASSDRERDAKVARQESGAAADDAAMDMYQRAFSACMEGRGYTVR